MTPHPPFRAFLIQSTILLATLACLGSCLGADSPNNAEMAKANGGALAAAIKFLAILDDSQRSKVVFDFKDAEQRKRWSNLPTSFVKRAGLRMGDLKKSQRDAVLAVLRAALSPSGYEKIVQIVEADENLKINDKRGGPGGAAMFGHDNYYVSFLGQPSRSAPWMLQYGGHHLGINITFVGEQSTLAPSHTGVQPALYELEGKTVRPLGHETDKAFDLMTSLNEAQRKKAILGFQMHDLVLGPGKDGQTIQPEGIQGADLTDKQRAMLLDLASEWVGIQQEAIAKAKMAELKKNLAETWFAWSGPTEKGGAAYFRIQGPTVIIEYAPQRLGGDATQHLHTIYRDPTNDYGVKWWKP